MTLGSATYDRVRWYVAIYFYLATAETVSTGIGLFSGHYRLQSCLALKFFGSSLKGSETILNLLVCSKYVLQHLIQQKIRLSALMNPCVMSTTFLQVIS